MKHIVFYNLPNAGASIVMPVLEEFAAWWRGYENG